MKKIIVFAFVVSIFMFSGYAQAESVKVPINKVSAEGIGDQIGNITFTDANKGGVDIMVEINGISAGEHGMHIHVNPDCGPAMKDGKPVAALAAGGHYDPNDAKFHAGPEKMGHKGDLPKIMVDNSNKVKVNLHAPRLTVKDIKGHSVIVHAGGDNYSDNPPLGGGGDRIACGVIK